MKRTKAEQQKRYVVILMVALAVVLAWRVGPLLFPGTSAAARAREEQQALARGEVVEIDLAALEMPARAYTQGRNIFNFGQKPTVARTPPPPTPPPTVRPTAQPVPLPPPPVAQRPPFKLPLLGIFGPKNRRIAVFKDGDQILNVLRDGTVKDRFYLAQINLDYVDVAHEQFPDQEPQRVKIGKGK